MTFPVNVRFRIITITGRYTVAAFQAWDRAARDATRELRRAIRILGLRSASAPVNYPAILADMVAYNDGKPLSCLA
jgi:hypothetical protein